MESEHLSGRKLFATQLICLIMRDIKHKGISKIPWELIHWFSDVEINVLKKFAKLLKEERDYTKVIDIYEQGIHAISQNYIGPFRYKLRVEIEYRDD